LTSWVPDTPGFAELCDQWEKYLEKYQALAKENNVCIVPGTIVARPPGATAEDKLLNQTYFIDNTGKILNQYIKKNLWHPERQHLASSMDEPHVAFDSPLGRCGMLICWDLAFRELICDGAKLIIIPSFWTLNDCGPEGAKWNPAAEALLLDSFLTTRCYENTCGAYYLNGDCTTEKAYALVAIVFVNAGGPPGEGYAGLSQVTIPFVGPITRLGGSAEGMSIVDLDLSVLDVAEDNYKIRKDLASHDWHYDYRHDRKNEKL